MSLEKINARIKELNNLLYFNKTPLEINFFQTSEELTVHQAVTKKNYKKIKPGFSWGDFETYGWFKIKFNTPPAFLGKSLYLKFKVEGEGTIYHKNIPAYSIYLNYLWYPERTLFKIEEKAETLKSYEFIIEVSPLNVYDNNKKYLTKKSMFIEASLVSCPQPLMQYYYNLSLLYEIAETLNETSLRRHRIEETVSESLAKFNFEEKDEKAIIKNVQECNPIIQPLLSKRNSSTTEKFLVCGHSHLDVAWIWPYYETIKKIARTASITLKLMKEYKNFKFLQTTALYYEILNEYYPELYKEIKSRIREDRWEAGCVSYIEPDCTLTSGESLIRQFLFGTRFSKQILGKMTKVVWFPDTFGFSAALPQIIKKSGLQYFMTIKMTWNDTNQFPYSIFQWEGIDGTKILSYIPPCPYNAYIKIKDMKKAWEEFKNKDSYDELLYPYGVGDGGGGINHDMLEYLSRMKDIEGAPKCEHSSMENYFHIIEKKKKKLPVWNGELYLELHRGTYTTQALNKKYNRRAENLMKEIELFSVMEMFNSGKYLQDEINKLWKIVLKNQFHDILPGTSITRVHKESHEEYRTMIEKGERILYSNITSLKNKINTKGKGIPVIIFNSYSKTRSSLVEIDARNTDANYAVSPDGELMPIQKSGKKIIFRAENIPPLGWKVVWLRKINQKVLNSIKITKNLMENALIRLKFNNKGKLISIYDKENQREILKKGVIAPVLSKKSDTSCNEILKGCEREAYGNELELFIDKPVTTWSQILSSPADAWDIENMSEDLLVDTLKIKKIEVSKKGPVFGELKISGTIGRSYIEQHIGIYSNSRRIDFKTKVSWNENRRMLKVSFPVNIHSNKAVYDIQFGNIERPTSRNHSWEWAKYEVYAHKWADLSEGNYGVALLNDCKYGYSIKDNIMRLSLLRSTHRPDPSADRGEHEFTYSLLPHKGNFRDGKVVDNGYDLNIPLIAMLSTPHDGELNNAFSFFSVDKENVIIETIKKAEDDDPIILRLYEAYNMTKKVKLKSIKKIKKAYECNLIEENEKELKTGNNEITFQIKPYEIKTFKLYF